MSLIDDTYFVLEATLPDSDYNDLTAYIAKYEKEILQKLLGYELWKLVAAYSASTSPQRIKDLVEGKEYEISTGETIKWNGLINDDKVSLISYYVYYWWVRNNSSTLHMTGNAQLMSENSSNASPAMKIMDIWNRLEELYGYAGQSEYDASCYNFLTHFESDYDEWVFTDIGNVNAWDI